MKTCINKFYDDIVLSKFYEETWNLFNVYCSRVAFSHHICGINYLHIKDANHFKELCIKSLNETDTFKPYNLSCMYKLNNCVQVVGVSTVGFELNKIGKERIILKMSYCDNAWISSMNIFNFADTLEKGYFKLKGDHKNDEL